MESDSISIVVLLLICALQHIDVLLCMATDLCGALGGDKVLGDVRPVTPSIHVQTMKELSAVGKIGVYWMN